MKMHKFMALALVLGAAVFGHSINHGTESLDYYTYSSYNAYDPITGGPVQEWIPAQMITLSVQAGSTVYLTNYVSSWYGISDLGDSNYAAGYDMSANKYGYVFAKTNADGTVVPVGEVHYASGAQANVTYENPTGPQSVTTIGYLLDKFDEDAEIFFVMTPNGYDKEINSFEPVNDPDNDPPVISIIASRQVNTVDMAGSVRVNFGTEDGIGHEFVVGYEATRPTPLTGQPLPGMMLCGMLCLGTVSVAFKMCKRSRK